MSARPHGLDSATARMPQVARRAVASTPTAAELCWAVLVVDDEPAVHQVTRLALDGTIVLDRPLRLLHAHSGIEARAMLRANPEVALILLDVVMERDDAGLEFVRHVREDLGNQTVRIVLRTGQPGQAPEHHVMVEYDVNDYRHKTELTASQLFTSVVASIRAYRDIQTLRRTQRSLASVVGSSAALFGQHDLREFAVELLRELGQTAFFEAGAFFEHAAALGAVPWCGAALASHSVVNAAPFEMPTTLCSRLQGPPCTLVSEGRHHAVRFRQPKGAQATLALRASRELEDDERQVLALHLRLSLIHI